jgi:hypothetical protein
MTDLETITTPLQVAVDGGDLWNMSESFADLELPTKDRRAAEEDMAEELTAELDRFVEDGHIQVEHWDEDKTSFKPILYLHADTYRVEPLFAVPSSRRSDPVYLFSPKRQFAYCNGILPKGIPLRNMERPNQKGLVFWTGDIVIPTLIDMHIDSQTGERMPDFISEWDRARHGVVWMSLTPNEMLSQRSGIQKAAGKVVIGGLGMGWFMRKVCEKPEVEQVIVVEKSRDLLDWFGYEICRKHSKVTEVICDDVYNHVGTHGNAQYLLDIWPISQGARTDRQYLAAKRKWGKRIWAWGIN